MSFTLADSVFAYFVARKMAANVAYIHIYIYIAVSSSLISPEDNSRQQLHYKMIIGLIIAYI